MIGHRLSSCRLPDAALLGVTINVLVLLLAPVIRPDLSLLQNSMSYYTIGPWGMVQSFGFIAMGVSSLTLAWAIAHARLRNPWKMMMALLLVIAGAAAIGLVVYPMGQPAPTTFIGDAHQTAGTIGGVAQLVTALTLVLATWRDPRWRGLLVPAAVALGLAVTGAIVTQLAIWRPDLGIPMGASMRLVVVPLVILWGLVALRLRQRCGRAASRPAAAR
jgi:hypothetical protein